MTSLASYSPASNNSVFHMSGHHSLPRPSLQNSSHSSAAGSYASQESDRRSSTGTACESHRSTQTPTLPLQRGVTRPESDSVRPAMEVDGQSSTGSSASQHLKSSTFSSPNAAMSSSPKASPRSKPESPSASSSPADRATAGSVSPRQRTDGFNPPSGSGSSGGNQAEVKAARTRSTNQASGISLSRSNSSNGRHASHSSPKESRSPRRIRVDTSKDDATEKAHQDGTAASQPSNSDSSYTPASSPPPRTPNSDHATHDGDPPSSASDKRTETTSSSSETKEGSSSTDSSATPHMDHATYPTQDLLKLLASLLQQIASANDALREEAFSHKADHASPASASASSYKPMSPSTRNRTRTSSGGEVTGQLCIPPFRPRPANVQQSRDTPPSAKHNAGTAGIRTHDSTDQQESAPKEEIAQTLPVDALARETHATPLSASEKSEGNMETTVETSTSESAKASPNDIDTASDPPSSANTLRPRRSNPYRITTTAARQSLVHPSAILCFHARNVPSISIEAYLQRILKYCPITNEVFLSLLVYFDRMSKMQLESGQPNGTSIASEVKLQTGIQGFAIDSYNVHRLVIAGITVASKFFSDVFYTNSRYAKSELNQLELQFLLLNDFNLVIPLDEMQRYADQLLAYGQGKGMVEMTGPGIVYGSLPLMKPPSEAQRDSASLPQPEP